MKDVGLIVGTITSTRDCRLGEHVKVCVTREALEATLKEMNTETFTPHQVQSALLSILDFTESFHPHTTYAGNGWAARCLRYHLKQLLREEAR